MVHFRHLDDLAFILINAKFPLKAQEVAVVGEDGSVGTAAELELGKVP